METSEDAAYQRCMPSETLSSDLDFVDCCNMAISERLNITKIYTLDRRDFGICRPTHCDYLELLP